MEQFRLGSGLDMDTRENICIPLLRGNAEDHACCHQGGGALLGQVRVHLPASGKNSTRVSETFCSKHYSLKIISLHKQFYEPFCLNINQ